MMLTLSSEPEPYIPSAMDDWDEAFWVATGIVVPGSTWGVAKAQTVRPTSIASGEWRTGALYLKEVLDAKPGTPIRIPMRWGY